MDYDDIIDTQWPPETEDVNHPRMDLNRRAKIFLPFAALTGYEQALEQTLINRIKEVESEY